MLLPAILLSGGASTRMGSPKALLRAGARTFLERVATALLDGGADEVVVVTGAHHPQIAAEVDGWPASWPIRLVRNETPGADQLSSIQAGLALVDHPGADVALVALVDHPLVSAATVARLREAFGRTRAPVVRPRFLGRHGHPVVFGRETFEALRTPWPDGAKSVLRRFEDRQIWIDVDDEGVVLDVDTPEDYERVRARFA
ncbi:MAG: nucleotidyltransferase family protein [Vicinamibacterales bacterium]|nr:nucleotidyltransferase family protein [Vicinamibacterales bacterium]